MSEPIPPHILDTAELEVRRWPMDTNCVAEVARVIMAAEKRGEEREREACAETARRDLEVNAQVAARSNLVGYAAEFYNAAKFSVPAAIRKRGEG